MQDRAGEAGGTGDLRHRVLVAAVLLSPPLRELLGLGRAREEAAARRPTDGREPPGTLAALRSVRRRPGPVCDSIRHPSIIASSATGGPARRPCVTASRGVRSDREETATGSTEIQPARDGAEIVVIGGGVLGCSIAYHLAVAGKKDVLLVERTALASGTTSASAGLVGQLRSSRLLLEFVQRTLRAIGDLDRELREPVGYRRVGSLLLASTPAREEELRSQVLAARRAGIAVEWIDEAEARRLAPALDPAPARRIAHVPGDGFVDAYQLTMAYARAAATRGARIWTGVGVQAIQVSSGRVTGVATDRGVVECRWAIDAAGPWAGTVGALAGVALPLAPVRSHFWITAPHQAILAHQPVIRIPDARVYTRPEVGGLLIGVHERESRAYDARELGPHFEMRQVDRDWDVLARQLPEVLPYFPFLEDAPMIDGVAGLTTYSPDGRPVLGRAGSPEGFLAASGCCGLGVAASGGYGSVIAELLVDGRASLDLTPFRVDRFGPVDPNSVAFRQRCAMARSDKDAVSRRDASTPSPTT